MYVHTHVYINNYTYIHLYIGLEIGSVYSQNANHFWGNCESLCQNFSQYCQSL